MNKKFWANLAAGGIYVGWAVYLFNDVIVPAFLLFNWVILLLMQEMQNTMHKWLKYLSGQTEYLTK